MHMERSSTEWDGESLQYQAEQSYQPEHSTESREQQHKLAKVHTRAQKQSSILTKIYTTGF